MSHFAKVNEDNEVTQVIVISDEHEDNGQAYINNILGLDGLWIRTSYTSRNGKRIDPVTEQVLGDDHFRYNFAGIGYKWNDDMGADGAFIPPKPDGMESWILSPDTASWMPPVPEPDDGGPWTWDEETTSWIEISETE